MNSENADGTRDMCLADVGAKETTSSCIPTPGLLPDRAIHWNPDGREIIAHAVKSPIADTPTFGIARWRLKKDKPAFSANAADWNKGRSCPTSTKPGKGVLDAAISPDGKQLARGLQPGLVVLQAVPRRRRATTSSRTREARRSGPARWPGAATARS